MDGQGKEEGREGDWVCKNCSNRNYAFRSFCNRCKQPRLLVDNNTPADSKWLPRFGDWICSGCTNNNYASREKCKKCGQLKQVAALHPSLSSRIPLGEDDRYGNQTTASVPYGVQHPASFWQFGLPFATQGNMIPPVPNGNGWRAVDWMCKCGFHNYSSRLQCKICDAPASILAPPSIVVPTIAALGTKRMASEDISNCENKRLNAGQQFYPVYDSIYPAIINERAEVAPNSQVNLKMLHGPGTPVLLGKGAKQWREGDWMCSNCSNHNYASRAQCNRYSEALILCKEALIPEENLNALVYIFHFKVLTTHDLELWHYSTLSSFSASTGAIASGRLLVLDIRGTLTVGFLVISGILFCLWHQSVLV